MKGLAVRLLAIVIVAAWAVGSAAEDDGGTDTIPPTIGLVHSGLECRQVGNCGHETQLIGCLQQSAGASCTFCSAAQTARFCTPNPTATCRPNGSKPPCGSKVSGHCITVSGHLTCSGSILGGDCKLLGCS